MLHHLQGPNGLGDAISSMLSSLSPTEDVLVFDFDRTLTNGFASPDAHLPMEKRIRGGLHTLHALRQAKERNLPMYIVTARNPSRLTIEQLEASMKNCQSELGDLFLPSPEEAYIVQRLANDMHIAYRGNLYASDYSKPNAIQHIVTTTSNPCRIHFFDDFVGNAFDVAKTKFSGCDQVHAYWWDSYSEEVQGIMGMVSSFSSDFTYQPGTAEARLAFGVSESESSLRLEAILNYERDHGIKKPPMDVEKPLVSKMDMSKFQALTFGGKRG